MARYEILGASRDTGDEHTFTIDAENQRDAELAARKRGILVSSIKPTSTATTDASQTPSPSIDPPNYRDIKAGASWLNFFAGCCIGLGVVAFLAGIVLFAIGAWAARTEPGFSNFYPALTATIVAVVYFAVAAFLRMTGSIGLAIRDIARNSFRH